jgi:MOSC domain-containing protein YiiM
MSGGALTPGPSAVRAELTVSGVVEAVHASAGHTMSKPARDSIRLVAGMGVEGDAHSGETVKHRSRVQRDPSQPNLRQVHLIHAELHDELRERGFQVASGAMGENITTRGVDLLGMPTGARLHIGEAAVVEVTGLRNPCGQLNGVAEGLMAACVEKDEDGNLVRKAGVMGVVVAGGEVWPGNGIRVELPEEPHQPLPPV